MNHRAPPLSRWTLTALAALAALTAAVWSLSLAAPAPARASARPIPVLPAAQLAHQLGKKVSVVEGQHANHASLSAPRPRAAAGAVVGMTSTGTPSATGPCVGVHGPTYYVAGGGYYALPTANFATLLAATQDFTQLMTPTAQSILQDTSTSAAQYLRYLLTAELNVALTPQLGDDILAGSPGYTVNFVLHRAYLRRASPHTADNFAVGYIGGGGQPGDYVACRLIYNTTPYTAGTPELGSGELLATGLASLVLAALVRRRRCRAGAS